MRPFVVAVCWYVLPGLIWILASDAVVALVVSDPVVLGRISVVKGVAFVVVTIWRAIRLASCRRSPVSTASMSSSSPPAAACDELTATAA